MPTYVIKAFGVTKDIIVAREKTIDLNGATVRDLRDALNGRYPALGGIKSLMIAVNRNYAEDTLALGESDEIALIPPVSGG